MLRIGNLECLRKGIRNRVLSPGIHVSSTTDVCFADVSTSECHDLTVWWESSKECTQRIYIHSVKKDMHVRMSPRCHLPWVVLSDTVHCET